VTAIPEHQVAVRVGLPGLDQGIVADDGFLHDVLAAVERPSLPSAVPVIHCGILWLSSSHCHMLADGIQRAYLARLGRDRDGAVRVVLDGHAARLNERAVCGRREERWNARATGAKPLCQGALGCDLRTRRSQLGD